MKIEETYEFWSEYIEQSPRIRFGVLTRDYKDLICCKLTNSTVCFIKHTDDPDTSLYTAEAIWHRLDGPATITGGYYGASSSYWVNDRQLNSIEFRNHPEVKNYRINELIKEVLDEK